MKMLLLLLQPIMIIIIILMIMIMYSNHHHHHYNNNKPIFAQGPHEHAVGLLAAQAAPCLENNETTTIIQIYKTNKQPDTTSHSKAQVAPKRTRPVRKCTRTCKFRYARLPGTITTYKLQNAKLQV